MLGRPQGTALAGFGESHVMKVDGGQMWWHLVPSLAHLLGKKGLWKGDLTLVKEPQRGLNVSGSSHPKSGLGIQGSPLT